MTQEGHVDSQKKDKTLLNKDEEAYKWATSLINSSTTIFNFVGFVIIEYFSYFNMLIKCTMFFNTDRSSLRAILILEPLLGATWIFGILQFDQASSILFSYLFVICNTLQVNVLK